MRNRKRIEKTIEILDTKVYMLTKCLDKLGSSFELLLEKLGYKAKEQREWYRK